MNCTKFGHRFKRPQGQKYPACADCGVNFDFAHLIGSAEETITVYDRMASVPFVEYKPFEGNAESPTGLQHRIAMRLYYLRYEDGLTMEEIEKKYNFDQRLQCFIIGKFPITKGFFETPK